MNFKAQQNIAYKKVPLTALALAAAIGGATYGGELIGHGAEMAAQSYKGYVSNPERIKEMKIAENKKCQLKILSTDWETGVTKIGGSGCANSNLDGHYVKPAVEGLKSNSEISVTRDQRYVIEQVNMKFTQNNTQADSYVESAKSFTEAAKGAQVWAAAAAGAGVAFPVIFALISVGGDLGGKAVGGYRAMARRREEISYENV